MDTPFGPQLIGETEKTLNALLLSVLDGTGLTERHWVTLRLARAHAGTVDGAGLVATVADRAHFADAADLVGELTGRGLLEGGQLTASGRERVEVLQATIADLTAPVWEDLPAADVAAAARVLNEVIDRARVALR